MSKKFDRRSVRTYHIDELKWVIVRYFDGQMSGVLKGTDVEDEETGITVQEGDLQEGDKCMAKWLDKKMYKAKILFLGSDKDEAARQASQLKQAYPDKDKPSAEEKKVQKESGAKKVDTKKAGTQKEETKNKKETKSEKVHEKQAQIAAHERMVQELLQDQYNNPETQGLRNQIEKLKEELQGCQEQLELMTERKEKKKEEASVLRSKVEEQAILIKELQSKVEESSGSQAKMCICGGALGSSLKSRDVQQFIAHLSSVCTATNTQSSSHSAVGVTASIHTPPPPTSGLSSPPPTSGLTSPVASRRVLQLPSSDGPDMVDLGGGVMIKRVVRDACLTSAKGSTSKLIRNLLQAFFSNEELGASSAEGKGSKPALPVAIVTSIKEFVMSKSSKTSEREIVQIMNCQCSDSRKKVKNQAQSHPVEK